MKKTIGLMLLLFLAACSSKLDPFAQCVTDSGATFYGAFWCPHCANQKQLFGSSIKNIDYVECSLPDRSGQTAVCNSMNITNYPTWVFADGSRVTGTQQLATLAQKTGCQLPA
ncbi:hypothetical protein C4580_01360 [Candidatus Woesearchaeota archaeon]|nr:MAG: hypothetical protein C4580_01360 [Candidatus Woesearchaeota archaeon]